MSRINLRLSFGDVLRCEWWQAISLKVFHVIGVFVFSVNHNMCGNDLFGRGLPSLSAFVVILLLLILLLIILTPENQYTVYLLTYTFLYYLHAYDSRCLR